MARKADRTEIITPERMGDMIAEIDSGFSMGLRCTI